MPAKYCTIYVFNYNIKTDQVIGFRNINGKISPEIASNAFVIMLQSIFYFQIFSKKILTA